MSDDAEKPYDAGDPQQVRERRRQGREREREEGSAVQALLSSREGRDWMYALLEQCHTFHSSFSTDPLQMAFNEGERNIGIKLMAVIMRACPHRYNEMIQEANDVRSSQKPPSPVRRPNQPPWFDASADDSA
jgi:hypothetical protein